MTIYANMKFLCIKMYGKHLSSEKYFFKGKSYIVIRMN